MRTNMAMGRVGYKKWADLAPAMGRVGYMEWDDLAMGRVGSTPFEFWQCVSRVGIVSYGSAFCLTNIY